jgi:hypothetical protein
MGPPPDQFRSIELFEEGNQFFTDEYNKKLVKEGPRHLLILTYAWDGNEFIKTTLNQSVEQTALK